MRTSFLASLTLSSLRKQGPITADGCIARGCSHSVFRQPAVVVMGPRFRGDDMLIDFRL